MSRLKQLIHEVHHRSLWQVLGIYVVGGWVALQIVDTMAGALKLPDWSSPVALLLLIIGLPIVLATAFVQEGVGRREPGEVETTSGGTPIPSSGGDEGARGLFTWRNALLGGMGAFALWGVGSAVWLLLGAPGAGADGPGDGGAIESIAVLPFADMSAEGDQEYFSDGISEELLDALAKVPGLTVAARSSSFQFKDENPDIRDVATTLNVETVLEGSVRKSSNRLRITAQLVDEKGFHLWSETYDQRLTGMSDVIAIQEEIAQAIVAELRIRLPGGEAAPLVTEKTEDLEAYDLYLQGRYHQAQRSRESLETAADYYEQVIAIDPSFALAHVGLADAYGLLATWTFMDWQEGGRLASDAIERALALDPGLAEAYAVRGMVAAFIMGDSATAEASFVRAIELNPNYASSHHWYGEWLAYQGRTDESIEHYRRAVALDPLSSIINADFSDALARALHWEEAEERLLRTIELDPTFGPAREKYAGYLIAHGRADEALAQAEEFVRLHEGSARSLVTLAGIQQIRGDLEAAEQTVRQRLALQTDPAFDARRHRSLAWLYARQGRAADAEAAAALAVELDSAVTAPLLPAYLAARAGDRATALRILRQNPGGGGRSVTFIELGMRDSAFANLGRQVDERNMGVILTLRADPIWDPLRDDPRFDELVVKAGLDDESR